MEWSHVRCKAAGGSRCGYQRRNNGKCDNAIDGFATPDGFGLPFVISTMSGGSNLYKLLHQGMLHSEGNPSVISLALERRQDKIVAYLRSLGARE